MPKQVKISKDDILRAALEIVRNDGIERVSNREIAKKLNCSIRPIYYQFENSEELLNELNKKMIKYFYDFITNNMNDEISGLLSSEFRALVLLENNKEGE